MQVGVLALQGDVREHVQALRRCGANAVPVRRPHELDAVAGLVIPGGESTTIDKLLRTFGLFEPLRARIKEGMPAYGSCAGMIVLADQVLDGEADQQTVGGLPITVRRNAFGRQIDSFEADLPIVGLPSCGGYAAADPMRALFIRAPWVEYAAPEVEVLARLDRHPGSETNPDVAPPAVAIRYGNLLATSFHPELTADARVHQLLVEWCSNAVA